ncbi:MAG: hypothetical protein AB1815_02425 [Bacillota bacterium]
MKVIEDAKQGAIDSAGEAGKAWIEGVITRAGEIFLDWFTQAIDNLALGGMMVGCFLYMLGLKKGGQATWVSLAVWFTLKVLLWCGA